MLEVEVKAKIKNLEEFKKRLKETNAKFLKTEIQEDLYFNHPCRDFAETDEALRIRKINDKTFLTYKGKRLDAETKTREEIEINCGEEISEILTLLGFKTVANVQKDRKEYEFEKLHICVDKVEQLGNFVEIEGKNLTYKDKIFEILKFFGIEKGETLTLSYMELLMEKIKCGIKK